MKPSKPNTKLTHSNQPPPSCQTHQKTPLTVTIANSSTESNKGDLVPQSSPPMPENQLSLENWEFQHHCFHSSPEVMEPAGESQLLGGAFQILTPNLDKADYKVQVNQNEWKDDIPVDTEIFLLSDGQVSISIQPLSNWLHNGIRIKSRLKWHGYSLFHQYPLQTEDKENEVWTWSGVCCQRRAGKETKGYQYIAYVDQCQAGWTLHLRHPAFVSKLLSMREVSNLLNSFKPTHMHAGSLISHASSGYLAQSNNEHSFSLHPGHPPQWFLWRLCWNIGFSSATLHLPI